MNTKHEAAARRPSTAKELVAARRAKEAQAEVNAVAKPAAAPPAVTAQAAVVVRDNRSYRDRYFDEVAPASIVGRMVKFSKEGTFITTDDDEEVSKDAEFTALCDETLVGWVKFNGEGEPPDRVMGLLYDGFVMPQRATLGDLDEKEWDEGLDGKPADPWQHHIYLVLQDTKTLEMFTFVTSSKTGRRAVVDLLRHYDRTRKVHPDELPVVRLRTGGFNHKDERIGWVNTPVFLIVGKTSRDSITTPPDTSTAAIINDKLPF